LGRVHDEPSRAFRWSRVSTEPTALTCSVPGEQGDTTRIIVCNK
jgi:hypothetical protein